MEQFYIVCCVSEPVSCLFLETIKVYDGYSSLRKRLFRTLTVSKHCTKEELLLAAMKAFVVTQVDRCSHSGRLM